MDILLSLIDLRSFSNLWYWIALAVTWSSTSHWVLGVPFDMVHKAQRIGGAAADDLVMIARINVSRILYIGREAGFALTILVSFALTMLVALGWFYDAEFAQAVALLAVPLSGVGLLSLRRAALMEPLLAQVEADPEMVVKGLLRHRTQTQVIGMISISVTAFWGMFQNLAHSIPF